MKKLIMRCEKKTTGFQLSELVVRDVMHNFNSYITNKELGKFVNAYGAEFTLNSLQLTNWWMYSKPNSFDDKNGFERINTYIFANDEYDEPCRSFKDSFSEDKIVKGLVPKPILKARPEKLNIKRLPKQSSK